MNKKQILNELADFLEKHNLVIEIDLTADFLQVEITNKELGYLDGSITLCNEDDGFADAKDLRDAAELY